MVLVYPACYNLYLNYFLVGEEECDEKQRNLGSGVRPFDNSFRQGDLWEMSLKQSYIILFLDSTEQPKLTEISFNVSGEKAVIFLFYVDKDGEELLVDENPFFVSNLKYGRHNKFSNVTLLDFYKEYNT